MAATVMEEPHALHARAECAELSVALRQHEATFHDVARAWFGLHDEQPLPVEVRTEYERLFEQFSQARGGIESSYFPEHLQVAAALTDIECAAELPAGVRNDAERLKQKTGWPSRLWRRIRGGETAEERAWRLRRNRASAAAIHLEPVLGQPDDWESKHLLSACLTLHYKALEFLSSKHRRVCLRRIFIIISWVLGTLDVRDGERRRVAAMASQDGGQAVAEPVRLNEREAAYLWREFDRAEQYYCEHAERRAQLRYTGGMLIGILVLTVVLPAIFIVHGSSTRDRFLVTLIAGALGATVSVLMRLTRGTLEFEREAETRTLLLVGAARPFIGAIFGALVYVLIAGGLLTLSVTTPAGGDELLSYAGLAFIAGFSERVAQTTVASGARALTPQGEGAPSERPRRRTSNRRGRRPPRPNPPAPAPPPPTPPLPAAGAPPPATTGMRRTRRQRVPSRARSAMALDLPLPLVEHRSMYDYVIVGAGSAGCVLAARLTEDPDVSVLLLEAGPPDVNQNIHVPLGYLKLAGTELDWGYFSAPEPECNGRRIPLPRGRVLGGSSSTNAMVYIRGNPRDYDDWGIRGWSWADLLPYFLKAEDNERGASEWHGAGGPLPVSEQRSGNRITRAWVEAAVQAGLPRNEDFNGPEQDGAGMYQVTQRGGLRASAAAAYLHPATSRPNLTVLPNMLVHRVLFEGTRAVGVEASQLGAVQELRAAREVILCGGAYNSPQLLMLSGVGPAEHLMLRELEVVLDQPAVGENLSDHAATFAVWGTDEPESLLLAREPAALEEFMATQTGPFASNLAESGAFVRVEPEAPAPDVQFHTIPVQILDEGMADPEGHGVLVTPCLLTPEARGSVRLASSEPTARPIVRNNFYADARDLDRMVAALRLMLEIAAQPAVASYCATGMHVPDDDSDAALAAHARRTTFPIYHPVGTCAMGSVVDEQLRVNGLEALRVVDASVMPLVPRGNTNAPTIAIAERAADLIRGAAPLQAAAAPPPAAAA